MVEMHRVGGFFKRLADVLGTIAAIPVIGEVFKAIFTKTGEHVKNKLGLNADEAKKTTADEALFDKATFDLEENEISEIDRFTAKLRKKDCEKAEAFVLYVANSINAFARDKKEKGNQNSSKGSDDSKFDTSYRDYTEGIAHAVKFLKELLKKTSDEEKIEFLRGKNVFSLIPKKKKDSVLVKKIEKGWRNLSKESSDEKVDAAKRRYEESKLNHNSRGGQQ